MQNFRHFNIRISLTWHSRLIDTCEKYPDLDDVFNWNSSVTFNNNRVRNLSKRKISINVFFYFFFLLHFHPYHLFTAVIDSFSLRRSWEEKKRGENYSFFLDLNKKMSRSRSAQGCNLDTNLLTLLQKRDAKVKRFFLSFSKQIDKNSSPIFHAMIYSNKFLPNPKSRPAAQKKKSSRKYDGIRSQSRILLLCYVHPQTQSRSEKWVTH